MSMMMKIYQQQKVLMLSVRKLTGVTTNRTVPATGQK